MDNGKMEKEKTKTAKIIVNKQNKIKYCCLKKGWKGKNNKYIKRKVYCVCFQTNKQKTKMNKK